MQSYWTEFGALTLAHLLAVASPGPDFAMVLRQSLAHGRRTAIWTSLGIGTGILLHVSYSLLGIGLVLQGSPTAFTVLKYAGATYLAWIGVQTLRSARPRAAGPEVVAEETAPEPSTRAAWTTGFLTNALNPKATLFFVALFPVVVNPATPRSVQVGYGLWMALATAAWFSLVSFVFTQPATRRAFLRWSHWIDRALGVVFLGFAAGLALATLR
jgi:RhtB (resistance to homoserine/threonine) family protein